VRPTTAKHHHHIILHVDVNKTIPAPTGTEEGIVCYIIVVSKNLLLYDPIKNKVTEEANY